jgi:hypothetical protein
MDNPETQVASQRSTKHITCYNPAAFIIVAFDLDSNFNSEANHHKTSNLFYITMTIGFIVHNMTDILVPN